MTDFSGKIVIVTGATSGIGRSVALAFARAGAQVVVAGRDAARGAQVAEEGTAAGEGGGACYFHPADVGRETDVDALVRWTTERFGRLDIGVNTAGANPQGPVMEASAADYDANFDTNVRGTFHCLKYFMRAMRDTGGAIVNVGSIAGERPLSGRGLYSASKAAAAMLLRTAAVEGGPLGIRINEVAPGTIDTPMLRQTWQQRSDDQEALTARVTAGIPLRRLGEPDEVAEAILFLCSAQARYITGARVTIDGGKVLVS